MILEADLGDVFRVISVDAAAKLHVRGQPIDKYVLGTSIAQYAIEQVGKHLQQFEVKVRTGFLPVYHIEEVTTAPDKYVDTEMLAGLLRSR